VRTTVGPRGLTILAAVLAMATAVAAAPQEPPAPSSKPTAEERRVYRTTGARVAIGRDIHIAFDEEVRDAVVVVGGSVRIDGRVRDDVVVVAGDVTLGPASDVYGDLVLIGGRLVREPGAQLRGSVSDVSFGDWRGWSIGGLAMPAVTLGAHREWLTLFGALFRVSLLAVLMVFVLLVARAPVARIGSAAAAEPARAFLLGLAAALLFLPTLAIVSVALVLSIVGIPLVALLVPLALVAGAVALVLGFTALACRVGAWVEDRLGWRGHNAFVATAVGFVLIVGLTVLSRTLGVASGPVRDAAWGLLLAGILIEFIVWTIGLGATLMTGFGRWSTVPPPVPPLPRGDVVSATG
jgi:hypothetical protein